MGNNLLIISDICPTTDFTAGIALEKFVKEISTYDDVFFFTILNPALAHVTLSQYVKKENSFWTYKPNEYWLTSNIFFELFSLAGDLFSRIETKLILKNIRNLIEDHKIDKLVIVLQGQTMYRICAKLRKDHIPYFTITWDSWQWWVLANNLPRLLRRSLQKSVNSTYSGGYHFFPTDQMAISNSVPNNSYSVFTLPSKLTTFFIRDVEVSPKLFKIAFAGQSYANREIKMFIDFLDRNNWSHQGVPIQLHVFGRNSLSRNSHIYQYGWLSQEILNSSLAQMDCAFLPYPLDPNLKFIPDESFPSKLSDYLGSKLPIFYLGPSPCSASRIAELCGVISNESNFESIFFQFIDRLLEHPDYYLEKVTRVYSDNFSERAFRDSISFLLPIKKKPEATNVNLKNSVDKFLLVETTKLRLKFYISLWFQSVINLFEEYQQSPGRFLARVNAFSKKIIRSVINRILGFVISPYVASKIKRF